jgi:hypothetical protein
MKAKCPYCEKGCDKCKEGYIEVSFTKGKIYTRHCDDCGFDNGGRIVPSEYPRPTEKLYPCVNCGSEKVRWLDTGVTSGDL